MRLSSTSRSAAAVVAAVLLSAADATMSAKSECVRTRGDELAALAACGHEGSLRYCFSVLPEFFMQSDLETCFVNAGCTADESAIEALWTLRRCEHPQSLGDLRRRQQNRPAPQNPTAADTAAAADPTTQVPVRQTTVQAPAQTTQRAAQTTQRAAQTTQQAPQTTQAAQTTESSEESVVVVTQTVDTITSQAQTDTSSRLTCIITTTVDTTLCPLQSTGPGAGKDKLPCFPTQVSFPTCSPGLFCSSDSSGQPTCMRFNNQLDTGGVVVALFFAVAITAAIAWLTYMCCREKAQQKKLAAKAEAAAIAAASKRPTAAVRSASAQSAAMDRQPLMETSGQGYGPVEVVDHQDPFHDRHRA